MNDKIDIVIPWVDGNDPIWKEEKEVIVKQLNQNKEANSNIRFESWDNLHIWFRAIEKNMAWINKIFFVTYGHLPGFLDVNNPKIEIVRHRDYIPKEYLPTFNSNTIEMNYHRIQGLSENFILFNDDFFPLWKIDEEYYFKDNIVCDEAVEGLITPIQSGPIGCMAKYKDINNMMIINKYFKKREVQQKNWDKWYCDDYGELLERTKSLAYWYDFAGFHDPHMAASLKKSVLSHLWEIEKDYLDMSCRAKFRTYTDISQWLIRYWTLCEGNFLPRRTLGKFYIVNIDNYKLVAQDIRERKYQMISINEDCSFEEFEIIKKEINSALESLFPEKSSFEL